MWYKSAKEYVELPELHFPIHLKSGFVVEGLEGSCRKCGKPIHGLRGEVRDFEQCSDVIFVGLCDPCKTVVTCRFRHYKDGRILEPSNSGEWNEMTATIPLKARLKIWWRKFFGSKEKPDGEV